MHAPSHPSRRALLALPALLVLPSRPRASAASGLASVEAPLLAALEGRPGREREAMLRHSLAEARRFSWPVSGPFVMVNIAARELVAWRDGRVEEEMRVVVGRPRTPTPVRADEVVAVIPNPTWTPPASILREPVWRGRAADPAWLARHGFVRRDGRLVQMPGPANVLGRLKFRLAAGDAIYLHDTNERGRFAEEGRLLSHGCVRLQRPEDFAAFALGRDRAWVEDAIRSGRRAALRPPEALPILLGYFPAFPRADGSVAWHGDPYGRVAGLARAGAAQPSPTADGRELSW